LPLLFSLPYFLTFSGFYMMKNENWKSRQSEISMAIYRKNNIKDFFSRHKYMPGSTGFERIKFRAVGMMN